MSSEIKQQYNIVDVINKYVPLNKKGGEFYGVCPFHNDKKASLQVNERKQIFKCFACNTGGDAIDFVQEFTGSDYKQACDQIKNEDIGKFSGDIKQLKKNNEFKLAVPDNQTPNINHFSYGKPSAVWAYHNHEGYIVSYACRFDFEDGSKEVWPYTSVVDENGNKSWRWKGMPPQRYLYNLHKIVQNPEATVVLVEGEKCADHLQSYFEPTHLVATTWPGGGNSHLMCDFTPLEGRKILRWPDNDDAGKKCMAEIKIKGSKNKYIHISEGYPKKWDVADKNWQHEVLFDFMQTNQHADPQPYEEPKKQEPPAKAEKPKKNKSGGKTNGNGNGKNDKWVDDLIDTAYFRVLGYDKDDNHTPNFYFYSKTAMQVYKLKATQFNKLNLIPLAPINFWETKFDQNKRWHELAAGEYIGLCQQIGIFDQEKIRGRGAWEENENEFIFHNGLQILTHKKAIDLSDYKSQNIYEYSSKLDFSFTKPLKTKQSQIILNKIKWLSFERVENAYLLAGWCVIAPFCGALDWRPHIWLTGAAGSGKSWVMDNIIKTLLGNIGLPVQGVTTEAGLRGLLKSDARAVLFDEADTENKVDKERIQSVITLARSSSYKDGGKIAKGTASGGSKTFTIRSSFAISSIGVHLSQQSDFSRFNIISLKSFENKKKKETFKQFAREWHNEITPDFVNRLQTRTFMLLPVIKKNISTFSDAINKVVGSKRLGDQVGTLLAGAYSLISTKEIDKNKAIEWVEKMEWADEREFEENKDEWQLFNYLMETTIKLEGNINRTISELILSASGNLMGDDYLIGSHSQDVLKRHGFNVVNGFIYVSSSAKEIKRMLEHSSWGAGYIRVLERLPDVEKLSAREFAPGVKSRGIKIPLEHLGVNKSNINKNSENDDDDDFFKNIEETDEF